MSTPEPNRSLRSLWSERFQRGFRHSPGRLVVFGLFVFAGSRAPVEIKSLLYGLAFLAALWGFFALTREVPILIGFLPGLLRGAGRKLTKVLHSSWSGWPRVGFLFGLILLGIVVWRAWPTWHFQATASLREDETLNVAQYTSQGFGKVVGDYTRARNHIFYNVLNAILPGASSTWPPRARLLSFVGVACGLGAMIVYGWWRGWFLSACFFAGLVALNSSALRTLLEARGYGLLFFFAMLASIAFTEWSRSRSPRWLVVLAVAAVCGGYTLPYFIVFGGGLLFVAFCARPSQTSFSTGLLALAALLILYVPVLADVARVALSYGETYRGQSTSNYDTMDSLFHTLQFFVPHQVAKASPALALGFLAVTLATIGFGRFAPPPLRLSVAGISACLFGCLTFFYLVGSVPIRTGAFLAAPLAFLSLLVLGSALDAKALKPLRPVLQCSAFVVFLLVLLKVTPPDAFMPRQNWRGIAKVIQSAFPEGMPFQSPKSYGKLIAIHLGDDRPWHSGEISRLALAAGTEIAIDAEVHDWAKDRRPGWSELPEEVRFITFPLERNYNRLYFRPPVERGIDHMEADGSTLALTSTGHQISDPALLRRSPGHGDLLAQSVPPGPTAQGTPLSLPATLTAQISSRIRPRTANFLFSRSLADLDLSAEFQTHKGTWLRVSNPLIIGEFLSIPLPPQPAAAVRIRLNPIGPTPAVSPPLSVLEAWITP